MVNITPADYAIMHQNILSLIPDIKGFMVEDDRTGLVAEKGRKKNVNIRNLKTGGMDKVERNLDTEEYKSFMEISLRAAKCPLPMNLDVWDGLKCPYRCAYCYADLFRASLYTSFFDNAKEIGLRHINPVKAIERMKACLAGRSAEGVSPEVKKAIKMRIPQRFGIRFEDFTKAEMKQGISLEIMKFLDDVEYPYMINTKSDILSTDAYRNCLGDRTAVHVTLITLDDKIAKDIEPGAPTPKQRLKSIEELTSVTTVVPRIEPYMVGINSDPDYLEYHAGVLRDVGIDRVTWDTYSYSANNVNLAKNFERVGYNWVRMFEMTSDWQPLGSVLLQGAISIFQKAGIKCSTFDFGCLPYNDFDICCCADDVKGFENYNKFNILSAGRYIIKAAGKPVTWREFTKWAGEPLSACIRDEVERLWKGVGNPWDVDYISGITRVGEDSDGMPIYAYTGVDYRENLKKQLVNMRC